MISTKILGAAYSLRQSAINLIEEQIKKSPHISFGKHTRNGKVEEVVRFRSTKNGKPTWTEISLATNKGKRCIPTTRKITMLRKALAELRSHEVSRMMPIPNNVPRDPSSPLEDNTPRNTRSFPNFSYEEWCTLVENNDQTIQNGYRYGSRLFRSKSELLIAQILESLELEYKYEPIMIINGAKRIPDFAVYCPETNRYFLIEHLGMMDKTNYRLNNIEKVLEYETAGIRTDIDVMYSMEFGPGKFNMDAIYGKIIGIVLAQSHLYERSA